MNLEERIRSLLYDGSRLHWLMQGKEFHGASDKLQKILDQNNYGEETEKYVSQLEAHIKNISPHTEKLIVNGEEVDVFFVTRTNNGRE